MRHRFTPVRMAIIRKSTNNKCSSAAATVKDGGSQTKGLLKAESKATIWSSNPILGIYLEKNMIWKDTCSPVFIATLFTVARMWKQAQRPSAEDWIKKIQRTDLWTQRGKEKVGQIERVAFCCIHTAIRQIDSQWNLLCDTRGSTWCSVTTYKGGKGVQEGGDICVCGWFMLMYDRNQHNIVKQLSCN